MKQESSDKLQVARGKEKEENYKSLKIKIYFKIKNLKFKIPSPLDSWFLILNSSPCNEWIFRFHSQSRKVVQKI